MTTTDSPVTGVDFVSVPTQDLDRATDFYVNVVGLEPGPRWQRSGQPAFGAEFETGTVTIAVIVCEALGIEFSPHHVPIALHVDDVAASRADLEARGCHLPGRHDRQRRVPPGALSGSRRERARPASPVRAALRARLTAAGRPRETGDPSSYSAGGVLGGAARVVVARELEQQRVQRAPLLRVERCQELLLDALVHGAELRERVLPVGCQAHELTAPIAGIAPPLRETLVPRARRGGRRDGSGRSRACRRSRPGSRACLRGGVRARRNAVVSIRLARVRPARGP